MSSEIIQYSYSGIIPYFDYVFHGSLTERFDHSGVLSPAISLDPQYQKSYGWRLEALRVLENSIERYETARRAVEWCMLNDEDAAIRLWAKIIWDRHINK